MCRKYLKYRVVVMYILCSDGQPVIVDGHANVSDALHTATADANNGVSVGQNCACTTDSSPDHVTKHEDTTTPPENILKKQGSKRKLTLSLPLRHTSVVIDRATVCVKSESTSCSESKIPNTSTEHLYDSIDACASVQDPVYHTLEPPKNTGQQDFPNKTAANTPPTLPPVPPKPKTGFGFRHRLETCATVSPTDFHRKKHPFADSQRRSVHDQLRSVMAIYEEVPTEKKDSPSITLPLRAAKQETQDNTEQKKERVYHVLETLTPAPLEKNTSHVIPHAQREQQKQEETLKENKLSVTQTCSKVDEKILNVYQTRDEPGFPKVTKTPEENNYAEPFAPKRRLGDDKSHKCLFDDPSYCTQSHTVGHTSKRGNDHEESIGNQTPYDGPSYTTPVVRVKKIEDPSPESLFDDPKYNCANVSKSDSKVKFDDPKYQLPFHTDQQFQKRKVPLSRHSSSVEDICASVYSSTEEFLDASEQSVRGQSVDNLMDYGRSSIRHKIKRFDAKHRPNSVNMQHMKTTNV